MTLTKEMPDRAVLVAINIDEHRNEILIEVPGRTRRRWLPTAIKSDRGRGEGSVSALGEGSLIRCHSGPSGINLHRTDAIPT